MHDSSIFCRFQERKAARASLVWFGGIQECLECSYSLPGLPESPQGSKSRLWWFLLTSSHPRLRCEQGRQSRSPLSGGISRSKSRCQSEEEPRCEQRLHIQRCLETGRANIVVRKHWFHSFCLYYTTEHFLFHSRPSLGPSSAVRRMNTLPRQLSEVLPCFLSLFSPMGNHRFPKYRCFHPNKGEGVGILLKNQSSCEAEI